MITAEVGISFFFFFFFFLRLSNGFCANSETRMRWIVFSADTLLCTAFTPTEIQYCFEIYFFFFFFTKASLLLPLSVTPSSIALPLSLSLFQSIEVFLR